MTDIDKILENFNTLREFEEFLQDIAEADDKGQEVSRGMDQHDKSTSEKETEQMVPEGEEQPPGGEAPEGGEEAAPEGPTIDPVAAPGSQISIGKKVKSDIHEKPKTKALEVKGSSSVKVDTKPSVTIDKRYM